MPELPYGDTRPLDLRFSPPAVLLGFVATTWQIYLIREFAAQFHGSELTFSFVLAAWLLWGGLGGLWAGRRFLRRAGTTRLFAAALLAAPAVFIALRCSRWILKTLPGEVTASSAVLGFALAAALGLNFPLGAAFVRIAEASARNVARVYFWESAGAAAGGMMTYLIFTPLLPDWTALAVIQTAAAGASFALSKKGRPAIAVLVAAALGPGLMALDLPLQRSVWRPFDLVVTRDSPYGRIQITRAAEQITVYDNGTRAFSSPDPTAAEDAVHIPMLLQGRPEHVLLIGGGLGGALGEILKYPVRRVVYIEIDGRMVEAVRPFLGDADRTALDDARVHLVLTDGRAYLERSPDRFDVIIVSIPEPATAQFNRYYTVEFFRLAKSRLAEGGVFSFKTGAADNFMSPPRREYLGILRRTLRSVFEAVAVMPGENAVFCGSASPLRLDAEDLSARLETRGIRTMTLTAEVLRNRLHPLRVDEFRRALEEPGSMINSDGKPIGYFFSNAPLERTKKWTGGPAPAARFQNPAAASPGLPRAALPGRPPAGRGAADFKIRFVRGAGLARTEHDGRGNPSFDPLPGLIRQFLRTRCPVAEHDDGRSRRGRLDRGAHLPPVPKALDGSASGDIRAASPGLPGHLKPAAGNRLRSLSPSLGTSGRRCLRDRRTPGPAAARPHGVRLCLGPVRLVRRCGRPVGRLCPAGGIAGDPRRLGRHGRAHAGVLAPGAKNTARLKPDPGGSFLRPGGFCPIILIP